MQTLSSASLTCMASASAVECTATVAMPSSLHARRIRNAISPRLAMRILSNMASWVASSEWQIANGRQGRTRYSPLAIRPLLNNHQRFAEFDRLAVLDENLGDGARARRWNLVHRLHGFDDQQRLPDRDLAADFDERLGAGLRRPIGGADHRRGDRSWVLGDIDRHGSGRCRRDGLVILWHRRCDADCAGDPHPQGGAFDLDFGQVGLVEQQRELADQRAIVTAGFYGCLVVRLARHALVPKLSD